MSHPLVGGVILFARNYESPEQVRQLCDSLHALKEPPLLVFVDQEGGRVQRFAGDFVRLPAAAVLGSYYDKAPEQALTLARDKGWLLAAETAAAGVDMTLAPVADISCASVENVIGDRAWHGDPAVVAALTKAFLQGMNSAGMAGMAKHFPGHGMVSGDTHTGIVQDQRSLAEIQNHDLIPYVSLFLSGLPAVMTAHVIYPQVDSAPATYSDFWLRQVLRDRMKFTGLVVSDDLNMRAATDQGEGVDRVCACLRSGCDMAILCNDLQIVDQVLDHLEDRWLLPEAAVTPLRYKGKASVLADVRADARWQSTVDRLREEVGHA